MNYIDLKYVRFVTGYLSQFTDVGNNLYRFRCPFCGDSKKSKRKTRGYLYEIDDRASFKCHNCGISMGLGKFLSEIAPALSGEYKLEIFRSRNPESDKEESGSKFITTTQQRLRRTGAVLQHCDRILELPEDHHARQYLDKRLIPEAQQAKLFYIKDASILCSLIPGYGDRNLRSMDAIVIPFFDEDGVLTYLQCRFFSEDFRYMTFQVEDEGKKIWGLDRVDWEKPVYVCEGPFDAMFVENCIAVAGISLLSEVKYLRERAKSNLVLIFDKDYRINYEVFSEFKRAIDMGLSVVFYDAKFSGKDLNNQVEAGWSMQELKSYLERRTLSGLMARLELSKIRPPKPSRKYGKTTEKNHERY